jgi:hypothetical protein
MHVCLQGSLRLYAINQPANPVANERGQTWKDLALDEEDFDIIKQMCAVLLPAAQMSMKLEGDQYVTASLVLPMTYRLLNVLGDDMGCGIPGHGGFKCSVSAAAMLLLMLMQLLLRCCCDAQQLRVCVASA